MPNLGPTELIIIAVVLILLFGSKKTSRCGSIHRPFYAHLQV